MPDYQACRGENCKKKLKCARYMMKWGKYQSVITPDPRRCDSFWPFDLEYQNVPFELDEEKVKKLKDD